MRVTVKSPRELELMRRAGRVVGKVLERMVEMTKPGVTTGQLDQAAAEVIYQEGAEVAFKGYLGYPKHICVSVNEEVVHGIPGGRVLKEGDLVGVDVGARVEGYYGDAAVTIPVGQVGAEASRLIRDTRDALIQGIRAMRPNARLRDVSAAIQAFAESKGYGIVRQYVGHGIGRAMHEDPQVPNYVPKPFPEGDLVLVPGMALALEPMLNLGSHEVETLSDGWTVVTRDRSLSAHFEHSVAVLPTGPEVLTRMTGEDI